ncbi:hypothetical protein RCL_jg1279.t1 [Rhizophagus clarus]|uniref:Uncharacterized protein n=1 Tax=Rhizophagus clarus TaxID=94130 RepID=A0A8H3QXQ3_9GLOM|nr:hypothetical protein RCL_jg1279.t1 [Rhizophagus clarus]
MIFRRSRRSILKTGLYSKTILKVLTKPGVYSKVRGWILRRNFEGLGFPGILRNFKNLWLLDEDFEGLWFF